MTTTATLTNNINGLSVEVYATTNNPASSYGRAVWVDADNQAYTEVGAPTPFYTVTNYRNINTMQDLADYYNSTEDLNTPFLEAVIEECGWESDCHEEFGICHSETERCIVNGEGRAVVDNISILERTASAVLNARKTQGITISQLSEKTGINPSNLSRIERGEVYPNLQTLATICDALGLTIEIK